MAGNMNSTHMIYVALLVLTYFFSRMDYLENELVDANEDLTLD